MTKRLKSTDLNPFQNLNSKPKSNT